MAGRKIIICFDGTGNEGMDAVQKKKLFGAEDCNISNILKLHLIFGGTLKTKEDEMTSKIDANKQLSLYYSGVGTYGNGFQRILNQAFAPPSLDVERIKLDAYNDLKKYYQNGDKIYIFGFSRGAAIARQFAGLLDKDKCLNIDSIEFLGVFDTVASIGLPDLSTEDRPDKTVIFEDCFVCKIVKKVIHLLSIDEKRKAFQPTLMNYESGNRIEEVWFAGAHSDIGGGYRFDGLADITLDFMLEKIEENKLGIKVLHAAKLNYDNLVPKQEKKVKIEYADMHIQPDPSGSTHEQDRFFLIEMITLDDREVRIDENDKKSDRLPTIHHSVVDRLRVMRDYKPKSLTGVKHRVVGKEEVFNGFSEHKISVMPIPDVLDSEDSAKVRVYANRLYNHSEILLEKSAKYYFTVDTGQQWYDSVIDCNYTGWSLEDKEIKEKFNFVSKFFIRAKRNNRRVPDGKWFELCAAIGPEENELFQLQDYMSADKVYTPPYSGEFCPFANDLASMYNNNIGFIDVTITKV